MTGAAIRDFRRSTGQSPGSARRGWPSNEGTEPASHASRPAGQLHEVPAPLCGSTPPTRRSALPAGRPCSGVRRVLRPSRCCTFVAQDAAERDGPRRDQVESPSPTSLTNTGLSGPGRYSRDPGGCAETASGELPKLNTGVRFSSPAPHRNPCCGRGLVVPGPDDSRLFHTPLDSGGDPLVNGPCAPRALGSSRAFRSP